MVIGNVGCSYDTTEVTTVHNSTRYKDDVYFCYGYANSDNEKRIDRHM